jgi:hypothetical protein
MIMNSQLQVTWISGMPRSGTTWLSQIFASAPEVRLKFCPLFSYEFKNALDEHSSGDEWRQLFWDVYNTNSDFLDQEYLRREGLVPTFEDKIKDPRHLVIKSTRFHNLVPNIIERTDNVRFVHIVRHPCDCINSWLNNPREFPSDADPLSDWRYGNCRKTGPGEFWGFDDWKAVNRQALTLQDSYPERFIILRYEDLVRDTKRGIKKLFQELGMIYGQQTDNFINLASSKHDNNKRSVFKRTSLQPEWLEQLHPSIISSCLAEVEGTELEQFIKL